MVDGNLFSDREGALLGALFNIKPPKLVAITYTAVYDDGSMQTGAAVPSEDASEDKPFEVVFQNARGRSIPSP